MAAKPDASADVDFGALLDWSRPLESGSVRVELEDGTSVLVRPIREDDGPALEKAFEQMSIRSRYLRFFTVRQRLGEDLARKLTHIDHDRHRAWVVSNPAEPSDVGSDEGRGVAVVRLIVIEDEPKIAEAAIAIVDDHQGRGLGRLLLQLVIATARATGVQYIRFETLGENRAMRALLAELGAERNTELTDREALVYDLPIGDEPNSGDLAVGGLYEILRFIAASD